MPPATSLASSCAERRGASSRLVGLRGSRIRTSGSPYSAARVRQVLLDRAPHRSGVEPASRHALTPSGFSASTTALTIAGRRADRAGLAAALHAERVVRAQRHVRSRRRRTAVVGARHRVVLVRAGQQLAGLLVVDAALEQRLADALGEAAMDLALDDHRVDDAAEVVDGGEADRPRHARSRGRSRPRRYARRREGEVLRVVEGGLVEARARARHAGSCAARRRSAPPRPAPASGRCPRR